MQQYNARQVVCTWGGTVLTDGMPEQGENLTISRNSESATLEAQMANSVVVLRNDRTGTANITVYAHSEAARVLGDAAARQDQTGRAVAKAFMVRDYNGNELHVSDIAVVAKPADAGFAGDSAPTRTFTLLLANLTQRYGGGTEVIPEV